MAWRRHRFDKYLRGQARRVREHFGEIHPTGNGHGGRKQTTERRGLRRRSVMLLASSVVFVLVIGARRCKYDRPLTDAERRQARVDIYIGCQINDCTPAQLASQLRQLDAMPSVKEPRK